MTSTCFLECAEDYNKVALSFFSEEELSLVGYTEAYNIYLTSIETCDIDATCYKKCSDTYSASISKTSLASDEDIDDDFLGLVDEQLLMINWQDALDQYTSCTATCKTTTCYT